MSQEKLNTMLIQNFGRQTECIMGNVEMTNRCFLKENTHITAKSQCFSLLSPEG